MMNSRLHVLVGGIGIAAGAASGQVLYETGFEAPEWRTGPLFGQQGWDVPVSGMPSEEIAGERAFEGDQAVRMDSALLPTARVSGVGRLIDYDPVPTGKPVVRVSWYQFVQAGVGVSEVFGVVSATGRGTRWPFTAGAVLDQAGEVGVFDETGNVMFPGHVAGVDRWVLLVVEHDLFRNTNSVFADGIAVALDVPLRPDADDFLRVVGVLQSATSFGDSVAFIDNLLIEVLSECYADCDGSGELDFFDFLCFQNLFAAGDPEADCDGSMDLDFFDFLYFQNVFAAGCL